jgi:3-oxoacyl-[acyl-carrier-protein] synthase-3
MARSALIIGAETLSRVLDPYDRDSMIFSDGAGAAVLERRDVSDGSGILSTAALSHSMDEVFYIEMGASYFPGSDQRVRYMKMKGRKVYQYAIKYVAQAMKDCLDAAGIPINDLKKIFLHQANEKMDEGIIRELYKLYGASEIPHDIMPMSIQWLGNSSVATVPTLYDLVKRNLLPGHSVNKGDVVLFASVGAGMNINALCYRL